jgi:hypothetical protein
VRGAQDADDKIAKARTDALERTKRETVLHSD